MGKMVEATVKITRLVVVPTENEGERSFYGDSRTVEEVAFMPTCHLDNLSDISRVAARLLPGVDIKWDHNADSVFGDHTVNGTRYSFSAHYVATTAIDDLPEVSALTFIRK